MIKRKIGRRPQDTPVGHLPAENGSDEIGPLRMWTGMYTYPVIENVPVLDMASNPVRMRSKYRCHRNSALGRCALRMAIGARSHLVGRASCVRLGAC